MKGLIFTYALTYGGAVLSLFRPFYGLLIYISFSILRPEWLWHWSVPQGNYSRIVAIALLIGWVLRGFGNWDLKRAWAVTLCFMGFVGWACISAMQAPNQQEAWTVIEGLMKILLPFLVGITLIETIGQLKQLAWVILLSQGYVAFDLNMAYFDGFPFFQELGFGGIDNNCIGIAMNACIGLAFFLGLYTPQWYLKVLCLFAAVLMAHVILFSFSRGGMLGLIVNGAVTLFLVPKRTSTYVVLGLSAALVLQLAGKEVRERFMSSFVDKEQRDASAESRVKLWQDCLECVRRAPIFGIGPHHFTLVAAPWFGWTEGKEAHTTWLQVAAELGVPAVLLLASFYGICWIRLIPYVRRAPPGADPWVSYLACMVCASLLGFAVSAQFVTLTGLEVPYYVALIGAGVLKLTPQMKAVSRWEGIPAHGVSAHVGVGEPTSPWS